MSTSWLLQFFIYIKLLYESYLSLSTSFLMSYFKNLIQNQLSATTATFVALVISINGKPPFFVVVSLHLYNYDVTKFWLTSFILSIVFPNRISIGFISITENRISLFLFWRKRFSHDSTDLIIPKKLFHCLSLTHYLLFHISNSWFEIDSPLILQQSSLKLYLDKWLLQRWEIGIEHQAIVFF